LGEIEYGIEIEESDRKIYVWMSDSPTVWGFTACRSKEHGLSCFGWPNNHVIHGKSDSHYTDILVRAMFCLGFDTSPIEAKFNLTITAHEKLEWQLEFQRRLREETSQTGE
jgi:hypothetical protein